MEKNFLTYTEYQKIYPNFPIDSGEFDGIAQQAYDAVVSLVENRLILGVRTDQFNELLTGNADFITAMQKIVAQECQVLYNSNGLHATTGAADAGQLQVIDGVPFGQYVVNALQYQLRKYGLMSRV